MYVSNTKQCHSYIPMPASATADWHFDFVAELMCIKPYLLTLVTFCSRKPITAKDVASLQS